MTLTRPASHRSRTISHGPMHGSIRTLMLFLAAGAIALIGVRLAATASMSRGASGTWSSIGTLTVDRAGSAAVLLHDGRIFVCGGSDGSGALASAEVYSDASGFQAISSMATARSGHRAVVLTDGSVLVAGGVGAEGTTLSDAEIYDPAADAWRAAGRMAVPRSEFTMSLLVDGRALIAGGDDAGVAQASIELYDPATSSFSMGSEAMSTPRKRHSAAVLTDGRVMMAGGSDGERVLDSVEVYDPAEDTFTVYEPLLAARFGHSATRLVDGSVLIAGGNDGSMDLDSAEIYEKSLQSSQAVAHGIAGARSGHFALLLPGNGGVLLTGGTRGGLALDGSEIFLPYSRSAAVMDSSAAVHSGGFSVSTSQEGMVAVGGGEGAREVEALSFATLATDKGDYAPGDPVVITGSGWEPGEWVTLRLDERPDSHEERVWNVAADENGEIHDEGFSPDQGDLGVRFFLTGRGARSEAQITFTDATPTRIQSSSMAPISGGCRSIISARATLEFKSGPGSSPFVPLPGKSMTFTLGSSSASGITDDNGIATASLQVSAGATSLSASFEGDSIYNPVSSSISFSVTGTCDSTAPVIQPIVTGTLGSNGWYVGNVSVSWGVSDPESAITSMSGCGNSSVASDTGGLGFTCTATSAGGTRSETVSIKRDATPPSAALFVKTGNLGSNGWYTSDVTIGTSGTDNLSGPVTCTGDQQETAETSGTVFGGSCTNGAGLSTNAAPLTVKVDKTGPSAVMAVVSGTLGSNGWYTSDVTVGTSGEDSISGSVTCTGNQQQTDETMGASFSGSCTNGAGLSSDAAPLTVKVDKSGPSAALAVVSGTLGSNGWYTSDVTVGTSGEDSISGSVTCTGNQQQTDETMGASFSGSCTNGAGLSSDAAPLTVKVDKSGPSAAMAVVSGTLGSNGWYTSDVTVGTSGEDSISGPVTCTGNQYQTQDTSGAAFAGSCANKAGLSTAASPLTIKMDKTAPVITISAPSGSYILRSPVTSSFSCTDATSGIAGCHGPATSGSSLDTGTVGTKSFTVEATDAAGNQATLTRSYLVQYATGLACMDGPGHAILQPINADGSSVFKQKSTVPAKFRVCDARGESMSMSEVVSSFRLVQKMVGTMTEVDEMVVSTTPDTNFRWDAAAQQWIFNIGTKTLIANATYTYRITLNDSTTIDFQFGLK